MQTWQLVVCGYCQQARTRAPTENRNDAQGQEKCTASIDDSRASDGRVPCPARSFIDLDIPSRQSSPANNLKDS